MLKIALIWPYGYDLGYTFPLSLGYLKSNLDPQKYDVRIFDCALEGIDANSEIFAKFITDFSPDVVGVSSWSPMFIEAMKVLRRAKELLPSVTTVVGGAHATSYTNRVMENKEIDYLFAGEAEFSFPVFLEEFRKPQPNFALVKGLAYRAADGSLIKNETQKLDDLDPINWPDYEFMQLDRYLAKGYKVMAPEKRNAPIWATRGCPYRCTFCSAPVLSGRLIRKHSIEYLMKQISYLYNEKKVRWINIIDDNFTFDVQFAKDFCKEVIARNFKGLRFGTPNGIRMQRGDPELWGLMKKAGWKSIVVTPESGSPRTLKNMKKDLKLEQVAGIVQDMKNAGLDVIGYFILGYPGDTKEDLDQTISFLKTINFDYVGMSNFQPLPGTPLFTTT